MSDTLSLKLEHGPPDVDPEGLTHSQNKAASSALLPTTLVSVHEEAAPVSAAGPTIDGQTEFDYGAVPDAMVGKLRETAARIRHRRGVYLIQTGQDLLASRDQLKPGQFHRWIEQECQLEVRTAQLAMMVARYADLLDERQRENFSRLPMAIQYQLAAPSVPEEVRQRVLEASAEGRSVKVSEVKQLVHAATHRTAEPGRPFDGNDGSADQDEPETGTSGKAPLAEDQRTACPNADPDRTAPQAFSVQPRSSEPHKPMRAISQSKLDATTTELSKQAIIKDIFVLATQITPLQRVTLISNLSKLGDITAKQLAECLQ